MGRDLTRTDLELIETFNRLSNELPKLKAALSAKDAEIARLRAENERLRAMIPEGNEGIYAPE